MGKRLLPVIIVIAVLFGVLYKGLLPENKTSVSSSSTSISSLPHNSTDKPAQIPLSIDEKRKLTQWLTIYNVISNYLIFISLKKKPEKKVGMQKRVIYVMYYQERRSVAIAL